MANNIFLMQALLAQDYPTINDTARASPVAVLLDFKKAYDTLDRDFLMTALAAFGYDARFIGLVDRLHDGTTARFLVNGDLSNEISVRTGIRQGCPLAPLLFLIAAETLKYAISQTPGVRGLQLAGGGHSFHHSFSAFVDDSVVFVERGEMLDAVEATLAEFAAISGLQVQPTKSHAIVLNERCTDTTIGAFPIVPLGATVPYLGVEIGLGNTTDANWTKRLAKLRTSLGQASQLTTSLHDRVTVLNAIGLSALLFTAKFYSPTSTVLHEIDALWRRFVWHGTIDSTEVRAHRIAADVLALPRSDLGLGLRDIREAMIVQAAGTILQWNAKLHDKYWAAFHNQLQAAVGASRPLHSYPSRKASDAWNTMDGRVGLLTLGWHRANASLAGRYPVPAPVQQLKQNALASLDASSLGLWWVSSTEGRITLPTKMEIDWEHISTMVYSSMPHEIRSFWRSFPWADNTWISDEAGHSLRRSEFPGITIDRLDDLNLRPDGDGNYRFTNPSVTDPFQMRTTQRVRLVRWLRIIIVNYGFHHADPVSWLPTRAYSLNFPPTFSRYEWQFEQDTDAATGNLRGTHIQAKWNVGDPEQERPGFIRATAVHWGQPVRFVSMEGDAAMATDFECLRSGIEGDVILAGHPAQQHGPTLLSPQPTYRSSRTRRDLKTGLTHALSVRRRRERALKLLNERLDRAGERDPALQAVLRTRTVDALIARAVGETDYQVLFRYRLALGALNLRSNTGEMLQCPHEWCAWPADSMSLTHIVWDCPAARDLWTIVLRQWTRRHNEQDTADRIKTSLSAAAPVLARAIRSGLFEEFQDPDLVDQAMTTAWTVLQAAIPQQLWLRRNAAAFNGATESKQGVTGKTWTAAMLQLASLAAAHRAVSESYTLGRALEYLKDSLEADVRPDREHQRQVRLYYDGGARGNPGCGGAGSILLERADSSDEWTPVWWAATFLGHTTNNVAEHWALAHGLRAAAIRYSNTNTTVQIIGDSMLATRQLQNQIRTRQNRFRRAIQESRKALNQLFDYSFHHTFRTGNKAADWLANHAMDHQATTTSTDSQPTDYATIMNALLPHTRTDTVHPLTSPPGTTVDATMRQRAAAHGSHHPDRCRKRPRPQELRVATARSIRVTALR